MGSSELEVCYFLEEVDDYIPVKCSFHPDAITGDLLVFVVSYVLSPLLQTLGVWEQSPSASLC